jgi:hypothetical protein
VSNNMAENAPAAKPVRQKLSWGEKRDRRRQRRIVFEEVLGWLLVPALIYGAYLAVEAAGGVPPELIAFLGDLWRMVSGARG